MAPALPGPGLLLWQVVRQQRARGQAQLGGWAKVLGLHVCQTSPTLGIAVLTAVLVSFQARNLEGSLALCCLIRQPPIPCNCLFLREFKFGLQCSSSVSLATL